MMETVPRIEPARPDTPGKPVGRLAPSPTGLLHLGNAWSFLLAWLAARVEGGRVILRMEDLDPARSRPEWAAAIIEDLRWLGLDWDDGPHAQSARGPEYERVLSRLEARGLVYPCFCTRKELRDLAGAPQRDKHAEDAPQREGGDKHAEDAPQREGGDRHGEDTPRREKGARQEKRGDSPASAHIWSQTSAPGDGRAPHAGNAGAVPEPVGDAGAPYPGTCRLLTAGEREERLRAGRRFCRRLACPDGGVSFADMVLGPQHISFADCGGDFALRRSDGVWAYQLAVSVDDAAMGVTQVVRGEDILLSTPRQILLFQLLGATPPAYAHVPLLHDAQGERLAKRHQSLSLRALRDAGIRPEAVIGWLAGQMGLAGPAGLAESPDQEEPTTAGALCERLRQEHGAFPWDALRPGSRPDILRVPDDLPALLLGK